MKCHCAQRLQKFPRKKIYITRSFGKGWWVRYFIFTPRTVAHACKFKPPKFIGYLLSLMTSSEVHLRALAFLQNTKTIGSNDPSKLRASRSFVVITFQSRFRHFNPLTQKVNKNYSSSLKLMPRTMASIGIVLESDLPVLNCRDQWHSITPKRKNSSNNSPCLMLPNFQPPSIYSPFLLRFYRPSHLHRNVQPRQFSQYLSCRTNRWKIHSKATGKREIDLQDEIALELDDPEITQRKTTVGSSTNIFPRFIFPGNRNTSKSKIRFWPKDQPRNLHAQIFVERVCSYLKVILCLFGPCFGQRISDCKPFYEPFV